MSGWQATLTGVVAHITDEMRLRQIFLKLPFTLDFFKPSMIRSDENRLQWKAWRSIIDRDVTFTQGRPLVIVDVDVQIGDDVPGVRLSVIEKYIFGVVVDDIRFALKIEALGADFAVSEKRGIGNEVAAIISSAIFSHEIRDLASIIIHSDYPSPNSSQRLKPFLTLRCIGDAVGQSPVVGGTLFWRGAC